MLSMFLDIGWMVQKIKYLISTEVAQYGDSCIECATSDLVLHDALEVNNKVPASSASSKFFTAMSTPASGTEHNSLPHGC
jgi:hypothetical protein